jgi:hypothetical protein
VAAALWGAAAAVGHGGGGGVGLTVNVAATSSISAEAARLLGNMGAEAGVGAGAGVRAGAPPGLEPIRLAARRHSHFMANDGSGGTSLVTSPRSAFRTAAASSAFEAVIGRGIEGGGGVGGSRIGGGATSVLTESLRRHSAFQ